MKQNIKNTILLLILIGISIFGNGQDTITITGLIKGIGNKGIPDVTISAEGLISKPVVTDTSGSFSIQVYSRNSILILIPPEPYKSQYVYLSGRNNIEVKLSTKDLTDTRDDAIHFFGFLPKRDFISASSTLDSKKKYHRPEQSVDEYFNGEVAGIWGIGRSGIPGSGSVNYIRGIHSMNANTQPLYIIDGLPLEVHGTMESLIDGFSYNPLIGLNPADITDLTIIKDNANAPLYGVRGSNGIVLIETLKPTEVQTLIDVSFKTGMSTAPDQLPQLNSDQYRTYAKEVLMTSGIEEELHPQIFPGLYVSETDPNSYKYNNNTNWQNEVFQNAALYDVYMRILGGDAIARYGLSIGYQNNKGIIKETDFNRFSVRFVGSFNMFKWLECNVSSNLTSSSSNLKESARIYQTSPVLAGLQKNPLMIPYKFDKDGNQLTVREEIDELGVSNPLSVIEGFEALNQNYRFLTTFRFTAEINDYLTINSLIGLNFNSLSENMFMPRLGMESYYNTEAYNVTKSLTNSLFSFANDNYINYKQKFGNSHSLRGNAGFRINTNKFQSDWGIGKNSHENDEYKSLQNGTSILRELGGSNGNWNRLSFYGNVDYALMEKYGINLSTSIENSTRIGPEADNVFFIDDVPFGFFYGAGLYWRISNESILRDLNWMDDLKLRLSYGKSGNDDIGNFDAFNYFYIVHYRNTTGMVPGPMSDEMLSFEEYYHLNAGLDFAVWGGRFSLSADIFRNRTENMLVNKLQYFYMGQSHIPINNGTIENKGWEAQAFTRIVQKSKFSLDLGFNISHFENSVLEIANDVLITPFLGGEYISAVGENMLSFYGYRYEGVNASTPEVPLLNEDGLTFGAGDAIFSDLSGPDGEPDGVIDNYDKTIIGSPVPDFTGGISMAIRYGGFKLDFMFQGVYGNEVFNYLRSQNESMTGLENQSTAVLNRWEYEGHVTNMPRALWEDPMKNSAFSSRWIEDGSYMRLKNVTLSYKIPDRFLVFRNAEFFISGTNLITFSSYLGYDPEFAFSFHTMEQGIDYGLTPYTRTFLIGFKLGL